jgi:hypothetical protein
MLFGSMSYIFIVGVSPGEAFCCIWGACVRLAYSSVSRSLPLLHTGLCHQVLIEQYIFNQYSFRELHLFLVISINKLVCIPIGFYNKTTELEASNLWAFRMKVALLFHCRSERNGYLLETFRLAWHYKFNITNFISGSLISICIWLTECSVSLFFFRFTVL